MELERGAMRHEKGWATAGDISSGKEVERGVVGDTSATALKTGERERGSASACGPP